MAPLTFVNDQPAGAPVIRVDDRAGFQGYAGLGAAMTDTSAWLINDQLAAPDRSRLLAGLFGAGGIGLNLIRVPIGASDYTTGGTPYSYDDMPPGQRDPALTGFSIGHDSGYVIPALRQVLQIQPGISVLATPWSPPPWMKANGVPDNLGYRGTLLPDAYGPLAEYFVKFIQSYSSQGVPITAITPENEPHSPARYPSMELPPADEANFITNSLRPALVTAGLNTRIYGGDTGFDGRAYQEQLLAAGATPSLAGLAWHCYAGIPDVIATLHELAPSLDQIVSECSPGISRYPVPEVMIGAFRNWASTVALWNLALDPLGGPMQRPNSGCGGCTGIVTISEQSHRVTFNRTYYQLGQVGHFVQPGARRVASDHFVYYFHPRPGVTGASSGLDDVAFVNPDGRKVLIAYNNSLAPIRFAVCYHGGSIHYTLPQRATATFVWR
jgi:glucosylceramidase